MLDIDTSDARYRGLPSRWCNMPSEISLLFYDTAVHILKNRPSVFDVLRNKLTGTTPSNP
jgi:hypothetical protein